MSTMLKWAFGRLKLGAIATLVVISIGKTITLPTISAEPRGWKAVDACHTAHSLRAKACPLKDYNRCYRAAVSDYVKCIQSARTLPDPITCDPATNARLVAEARQSLQQFKDAMKVLRMSGIPIPSALSAAATRVAMATEMGVDLAEAAGQADFHLQKIVKDKLSMCATLDESEVSVCEARVLRGWQQYSLDAVLGIKNPASMIRRVADKWTKSGCKAAPL